MICPICKADISKPEQQYGNLKYPVCQSDYLAGTWILEDEELLALLKTMSLHDAMIALHKRVMEEAAELLLPAVVMEGK